MTVVAWFLSKNKLFDYTVYIYNLNIYIYFEYVYIYIFIYLCIYIYICLFMYLYVYIYIYTEDLLCTQKISHPEDVLPSHGCRRRTRFTNSP